MYPDGKFVIHVSAIPIKISFNVCLIGNDGERGELDDEDELVGGGLIRPLPEPMDPMEA